MTKSMVSWCFVQNVERDRFNWIANPLCITEIIVRPGVDRVNL